MKNSNLLNLILAAIMCIMTTNAKAQLEIKVDPVDIAFRNPKMSVEYLINSKVSVELVGGFRFGEALFGGWLTKRELHKGYNVRAVGKFYPLPERNGYKVYGAVYAGQKSFTTYSADEDITPEKVEGFVSGVMIGYKYSNNTRYFYEVAFGAGRNFGFPEDHRLSLDVFGRITVGYRF